MTAITLSYLGTAIRIEAAPSELEWLEEFLCPPFGRSEARPTRRIVYTTDPERQSAVFMRGPDPRGQRLACFVFDRRGIDYALWKGDGKETVIFDSEYTTFYVLGGSHADVEIVAHRDDRWPRVGLMRVVREIAMAHAEANGAIPIHGAAVKLNGRAAILAGPKKSGKTSLLLHLLRQPGAGLIANDRVVVQASGNAWQATGMPTVVNVRKGTRELFPQIFADAPEDPTLASLTRPERDAHPTMRVHRDDGGLVLNPLQLAELTGTGRIGNAPLGAFIFPRVVPEQDEIVPQRLDPAKALARLKESLFPPAVPLLAGLNAASSDPTALPRLVEAVPCFDCALGRNAYAEGTGARMFADLLGIAP